MIVILNHHSISSYYKIGIYIYLTFFVEIQLNHLKKLNAKNIIQIAIIIQYTKAKDIWIH